MARGHLLLGFLEGGEGAGEGGVFGCILKAVAAVGSSVLPRAVGACGRAAAEQSRWRR